MRSNNQIQQIKNTITDPYCITGIVSSNELLYLIKLFKEQLDNEESVNNIIKKNTGPVTLNIKLFLKDPVIIKLIDKLKDQIGNFEITAGLFFTVNYPHIIHNDDTYELPDNVYKAITIPLELDGFTGEYPKLCFFEQYYFHGPAKFFKGDSSIPTYYNKQIYDYTDVDGLSDIPFDDQDQLFTHLNPKWLDGLSLHSTLDWIPGNVLIFDSVRLHCASDFRKLGIKSKLGISIFTKKI